MFDLHRSPVWLTSLKMISVSSHYIRSESPQGCSP